MKTNTHFDNAPVYSCNCNIPSQHVSDFFKLFKVQVLMGADRSVSYYSPYQVLDNGFFDIYESEINGCKGASVHIFLKDYKLFLDTYKDATSLYIYDVNCFDDFEATN